MVKKKLELPRLTLDSADYVSPRELAARWRCSRSQVGRICKDLTRLFLGHGRNGMVRYLRSEVEALEQARTLKIVDSSLTAGRAGGKASPLPSPARCR
jgi:hypothetical protein